MKKLHAPAVVVLFAILVALFSLAVFASENNKDKEAAPIIKWVTIGEKKATGAKNARGALTSSVLRVEIGMRRGKLEDEKEFALFADAPPPGGRKDRVEISLIRPIKGQEINEVFHFKKSMRSGSYKLILREVVGDKIGKEVSRSDWFEVK